jgi:hypothetical protein
MVRSRTGQGSAVFEKLRAKINATSRHKLAFTKKQLVYSGLYLLILVLPFVMRWASPASPSILFPSFWVMALWIFPILVFASLRNNLSHFLPLVWVAWFIVGSINIVAAYEYYGDYYLLKADIPALIYIIFMLFLGLGMKLFEMAPIWFSNLRKTKKMGTEQSDGLNGVNKVFGAFLILFPFIWLGSLYLSLGYLPILNAIQGENLTNTLYSLDYGPLYGAGLINVLSAIYILDCFRRSPKNRLFYGILLVVVAATLVVTGKRHTLVLFFIAAIIYLLQTTRISISRILVLLAVLVGLYMAILVIREGVNTGAYSSLAGKLVITGGEYRVFAVVANQFQPGEIPGYRFGSSAIASAVNNKLLSLFGFDKDKMVMTGSAYTWGPIFQTTEGIRSGIISELYMAYGFYALIGIFLLGGISCWIAQRLTRTHSTAELILILVIYSSLIVSIVGQTTDTVGSLTLLLYAWILYLITQIILPRKSTLPKAETLKTV